MAQEIQILTWCDLDHAEHVPAVTWSVTITAPGEETTTYEVDLCEGCGKSYRDLRAEVVEHGRPQSSKSARRAPVASGAVHPTTTCPAPGCDYSTTTATGLTAHARTVHDSTVAELTGAASIPCPADGCARKFSGQQGLLSHIRTAHPGQPEVSSAARAAHRQAS